MRKKVTCYNCYKEGHFVRDCRGPRKLESQEAVLSLQLHLNVVKWIRTISYIEPVIERVFVEWQLNFCAKFLYFMQKKISKFFRIIYTLSRKTFAQYSSLFRITCNKLCPYVHNFICSICAKLYVQYAKTKSLCLSLTKNNNFYL